MPEMTWVMASRFLIGLDSILSQGFESIPRRWCFWFFEVPSRLV